jgi:thimet oligopeptidase
MTHHRIAAAILAAAAPSWALAASPNVPLVTMYDATSLAAACEAGVVQVRKAIDAMAGRKGPGDILGEWNRLFILQEDSGNVAALYATIHPDKDTRAAAEDCDQKFTSLNTEINQNEKIYARLKAFVPLNPKQAKLQRDLLQGFEDSGVALAPDKRARAKQIFDKIDELRTSFERNVRDDPTKVTFTPAEMDGLPEAYLKARKPDASGNYVLNLEQPSYGPFMSNAKSSAARERYYRARFQQGGAANLELLDQLFVLRKELAGLYGLPSYADYVLRRRMAGSPAAVNRFLADVKAVLDPVEKTELEDLRAAKSKELGTDLASTRLDIWDTSYYLEGVRRARFDIDQEKLRAYFPSDKSVAYALLLAERLYGVRFKESTAPAWHPTVRYYEMFDAKSGRYLANIYLDLFPRGGKRPGAFAAPLRSASRLAKRTPSAALVANLDPNGLKQLELETLLHEFGHVLNMVLADVEYAPQAISTVKWDFVEAPSQMFEEWARREQTLALFREVCTDCPRLTSDEIRRLEEARRYGQAIGYGRQYLLARLDMELSLNPRPPLEVWKWLESAAPLGYVEGTMFPASFRHIASGYASGYYGYMWSRVIARDMLSAFGDNLLDAKVGARYRAAILGAGTENEESAMVRRFLGREPNNKAFFAEITGRS